MSIFYFILMAVFAVWALFSLGALLFSDEKAPALGSLIAAGVVAAIVTCLFSITTVDSRAVGIQTSFGRYQETLPNGMHMVAPWSNVEEFSTLKQDLDLEVPVSFDGGSSGKVNLTVLWAIDGDEAEDLWKDWKTFDRVRDRVVKPYAQTEIAAVFSSYVPNEAKDGKNRAKQQDAIKLALSGKDNDGGTLEGRGVLIDSIQVTNVELGARAQESVDRIAEATSNTERATQEQERAKIEAETAKIRQQSQTEETLQRYCLEVLNAWSVKDNGNLPAMLNCGLGGGDTPVIVGK